MALHLNEHILIKQVLEDLPHASISSVFEADRPRTIGTVDEHDCKSHGNFAARSILFIVVSRDAQDPRRAYGQTAIVVYESLSCHAQDCSNETR